jgi:hypothetical protein
MLKKAVLGEDAELTGGSSEERIRVFRREGANYLVFCSNFRIFPGNTFESAAWFFSVERIREPWQRDSFSRLPGLETTLRYIT